MRLCNIQYLSAKNTVAPNKMMITIASMSVRIIVGVVDYDTLAAYAAAVAAAQDDDLHDGDAARVFDVYLLIDIVLMKAEYTAPVALHFGSGYESGLLGFCYGSGFHIRSRIGFC